MKLYTKEYFNKLKLVLLAFLYTVLFFLLYEFLSIFFLQNKNHSLVYLSILSIILITACILIYVLNNKLSILGFSGVFLIINLIIHFGTIISYFLAPNTFDKINYKDMTFIYYDKTIIALALCSVAMIFYVFSSSLVAYFKNKNEKGTIFKTSEVVYYLGLSLIIVADIYFVFSMLTGKFSVFDTYIKFREFMISSAFYPYSLLLISIGITFAFASGSKKQILLALMLYLITGGILLVLGSRGDAIYPLFACVPIYFLRFGKINKWFFILSVTAFFIIIPIIGEIRILEASKRELTGISYGFFNTLREMGFQLKTVMKVLQWIDFGEGFAYGKTYLFPINNMIARLWQQFGYFDYSYTRFDISTRLPEMAFSQVAEAYFNFGLLGVIGFFSGMGIINTSFEIKKNSPYYMALFGSVFCIFLKMSRNSFIFVPFHITVTIFFILIAYLIEKMLIKKRQGVNL